MGLGGATRVVLKMGFVAPFARGSSPARRTGTGCVRGLAAVGGESDVVTLDAAATAHADRSAPAADCQPADDHGAAALAKAKAWELLLGPWVPTTSTRGKPA